MYRVKKGVVMALIQFASRKKKTKYLDPVPIFTSLKMYANSHTIWPRIL